MLSMLFVSALADFPLTHYENHLATVERKKLPSNRKKPPTEPGGAVMLRPLRGEGRKTGPLSFCPF